MTIPHLIHSTGPKAWSSGERLVLQSYTLQNHSDFSLPSDKGRGREGPSAGELVTSHFHLLFSEALCHVAFNELQRPGLTGHLAPTRPKLRTPKCSYSFPLAQRPGFMETITGLGSGGTFG